MINLTHNQLVPNAHVVTYYRRLHNAACETGIGVTWARIQLSRVQCEEPRARMVQAIRESGFAKRQIT